MEALVRTAIAALITISAVSAQGWSYEGSNGPEFWSSLFPEFCAGSAQSPINIDRFSVEKLNLGTLELSGYDTGLTNLNMTNNGHYASIPIPEGVVITISGSGLPGTFQLQEMHFHWQSEHLINDKRFSLELHLVHRNTRYSTDQEARQNQDGYAVLGVLFKKTSFVNPSLSPITDKLPEIQVALTTTAIPALNLRTLLPRHVQSFFRYQGSLTTPTCNEVVIWTVFAHPGKISESQLNNFLQLQNEEGQPLTSTFRPEQSLNGRPVYQNTPFLSGNLEEDDDDDDGDDDYDGYHNNHHSTYEDDD